MGAEQGSQGSIERSETASRLDSQQKSLALESDRKAVTARSILPHFQCSGYNMIQGLRASLCSPLPWLPCFAASALDHAGLRLPGLTTGSPNRHASQTAGSTDRTLSDANAVRGTLTSAAPADLSMIDAAATTSAPASFSASIVSRVDPPVVITSSTTSVFSPFEILKPRRNVIFPASRSVQTNRAPNARATSWPITIPPIAGDATNCIPCPANCAAIASPNAAAFCGY